MNLREGEGTPTTGTVTALIVEELVKDYRTRKGPVRALAGVSFRVEEGEIVGLLGANGAGKTTAIKILCGLLRPTSGRATVLGLSPSRPEVARRVAALLEGSRNVYWRLSVEENLRFFAGLQGVPPREARRRSADLVARFGLGDKRRTTANLLSQGMKQKLALACALVKGTPLLLLDEPTLGLDVETSHELRGMIRELAVSEGKTVLLSSHDMGVVEDTCRRVVILSRGRVVADDLVPNLLALFQTRAYRVSLRDGLPAEARARLATRLPTLRLLEAERALEVELSPDQDVYALMDALREAGVAVEGVSRAEPDLEDVFLRIVRGER
ncbi:ABC transporter ATP-binding protein [Candidatus Bipolaricaulota bacterium]|nr:ABC transporter ATP-binding protein [Candidatus Bipolaricaulota bacterium]